MLRRTTTSRKRGQHNLAEAAIEEQKLIHAHGLYRHEEQANSIRSPRENTGPNSLSQVSDIAVWRSANSSLSSPIREPTNIVQQPSLLLEGHSPNNTLLSEDFGLDLSAFLEGEDPLLSLSSWAMHSQQSGL